VSREVPRNLFPRVVALSRPDAVSGVAVAVARMSALLPAGVAWIPLVVGPGLTDSVLLASPWNHAKNARIATWPAGASPVDQVLTVLIALRELGANVVVPNDCFHGFVAAAIDHARGLRAALWLHADHLDGDEIVQRCGELADSFRSVSAAGRTRALRVADRLEVQLPRTGEPTPTLVAVPDRPTVMPVKRDRLAIVYAGRLEKQVKRVLDLAALADGLAAARVPFELRIAGEGPARSELSAALAAHIAAGRAVLLGPLPLDQMTPLYAWSDTVVLVSGSEGMPTVVLEALSHGRPVLVTDRSGGATQLVEREGGRIGAVFPTGDTAKACAILGDWSSDRVALASMGTAARTLALQRFSVEARAADFEAFVAEAADGKRKWTSGVPLEAGSWWRKILTALEGIGPCSETDLAHLARVWLEAGGMEPAGVFVPGSELLPLRLPGILGPAARLVRAALERLLARGATRIAVYGAGVHTRKMLSMFESVPQVVAVIDDRAGFLNGPPSDLGGLPVIAPNAAADRRIDGVLISSDEHEREMVVRARGWGTVAIVEAVYGPSERR